MSGSKSSQSASQEKKPYVLYFRRHIKGTNIGLNYVVISSEKVRGIPPANEIKQFDRILVEGEDPEVVCIVVKIGAKSTLDSSKKDIKKEIKVKLTEEADKHKEVLEYADGTQDCDFVFETLKRGRKPSQKGRNLRKKKADSEPPRTTIEKIVDDEEDLDETIRLSQYLEENFDDDVFLTQSSNNNPEPEPEPEEETIPSYAQEFPNHYLSNRICDEFFQSSNIVETMKDWSVEDKLMAVALEDLNKKMKNLATYGVAGSKWSFEKYNINKVPNGYFQIFLTLEDGPKLDADVFELINDSIIYDGGWKCVFKPCDCKKSFKGKEEARKPLQRAFVSYVCCACGSNLQEKNTLYNHLNTFCRYAKNYIGKDKIYSTEDESSEDESKKKSKKRKNSHTKESNQDAVMKKTSSPQADPLHIYIDYLLEIARKHFEIGSTIAGYTFAKYIGKEKEANAFISNLATIKIMGDKIDSSQHGYKILKTIDPNSFKIYATKNFAFQVLNDETRMPISFWQLYFEAEKNTEQVESMFACKNLNCVCGRKYKGNTQNEVIWHYIKSNYSLACFGCNKGFKYQTELEKHFTHRDCSESDISAAKQLYKKKSTK